MRRAAFLLGFLLLASSAAAQFNTIWGVTTGQFNLWGLSIPQPTVNGTVLTYNLGALTWAAGGSGCSPGGTGSELQYRSGASTFGAVTGSSVSGGGFTLFGGISLTSANSTGTTDFLINPAVKASGNLISAGVASTPVFTVDYSGNVNIGYSNFISGVSQFGSGGGWGRLDNAYFFVSDGNVDSGLSGISQAKKQIGGQSDWQFGWEATTTGNVTLDTFDTGLARSAAGILKVTNGSTGLGSLIAAYRSTALGGNVNSATTITPTGSVFHVTGVTAIATINLPFVGFVGAITIIPDGIFTTTTAGNIALVSTTVVSKALIMTYDGTKWYPSY
jgi:hypothetical protein